MRGKGDGGAERGPDPAAARQHGQGATNAKRQMIKVTVYTAPGGQEIKLRIWRVKLHLGGEAGGKITRARGT